MYFKTLFFEGGREGVFPTLQLRHAVLTDIQVKRCRSTALHSHFLIVLYRKTLQLSPIPFPYFSPHNLTANTIITIFPLQSTQLDNPTRDPEEMSKPQGPCPTQCVKVAAQYPDSSPHFRCIIISLKGPIARPAFSHHYFSS